MRCTSYGCRFRRLRLWAPLRNIAGTSWHQSLPSFALRVNVCDCRRWIRVCIRFGGEFRIEVSGVTSCLKFGCGLMLFWEAFSFTLLMSVASLTRKFSFRVLASGLNFAWEVKAMLLNISWLGQHIRLGSGSRDNGNRILGSHQRSYAVSYFGCGQYCLFFRTQMIRATARQFAIQ